MGIRCMAINANIRSRVVGLLISWRSTGRSPLTPAYPRSTDLSALRIVGSHSGKAIQL